MVTNHRSYLRSPKWIRIYFNHAICENAFFRDETMASFGQTSTFSCSVNYSFAFNKMNVARVTYLAEKVFRAKPRMAFAGERLNIHIDFSGASSLRLFNLVIFLLNSDKKKLVLQSANEYSFTLTYGIRDLVSAFNPKPLTFDYHGWTYATSIVFRFPTFGRMIKFKELFPPTV
jgi:hypothetical protein